MLPNVTQSFKIQRPDLESRRAEAMLRLFIAEHYSTQLCKNMQPFERDRQEVCVIQKRGKL